MPKTFLQDHYHDLVSRDSTLGERFTGGLMLLIVAGLMAIVFFLVYFIVVRDNPVENCTPTGHVEKRLIIINQTIMAGKTPITVPTQVHKTVRLYNCPDGSQVWH